MEEKAQRKVLKRDEVLALLYNCYEILINSKGKEITRKNADFLQYSIKLADVYGELQGSQNVSEVEAIGFRYEEEDEEESPKEGGRE